MSAKQATPVTMPPEEWDFSAFEESGPFSRDALVACLHEYLREAGLVTRYDKPWILLRPKHRKLLRTQYQAMIRSQGNEKLSLGQSPFRMRGFFKPRPIVWLGRAGIRGLITWNLYSDEDILAEVKKWLRRNRPKDAKPKNQGKNKPNDAVSRLNYLKAARLLHRNTKPELRSVAPKMGIKPDKLDSFDQLRKRAMQTFTKLFPLLAKAGVKPRSCLTAQMQRRAAKHGRKSE